MVRAADRIYSLETELKDSKIQILTVLKEQEIKHVAETDGLRDQFKHSSEASMAMITKQSQELTALRVRKNLNRIFILRLTFLYFRKTSARLRPSTVQWTWKCKNGTNIFIGVIFFSGKLVLISVIQM